MFKLIVMSHGGAIESASRSIIVTPNVSLVASDARNVSSGTVPLKVFGTVINGYWLSNAMVEQNLIILRETLINCTRKRAG